MPETQSARPDLRRPRNVGLGLRLSPSASRELARHHLRVRTHVEVLFQRRTSRWVIAAEEGGGALPTIAHYVGYVGVAGSGAMFSRPYIAQNSNDGHRCVSAPELLRVEIFRLANLCNLEVTRYFLEPSLEGKRPQLRSRVLFTAEHGSLKPGTTLPLFLDRVGEPIGLSKALTPAIMAATAGALCVHCRHAHLEGLAPIALKPEPSQQLVAAPAAIKATSTIRSLA